MFGYDSLDSKWLVGYSDLIETIGDFETSRGYIYYSPWNMSLVYEGELNDSYTVPLVADKWNLVGMPFNDSIDNIYGAGTYTVYQWDGFDYMDVSGATLGTGKSYWVYPGVPDLAPPSFSFWGWLTGLFS